MSKVVAYISGGVVQYVGSNLENVEIVVVDADNLSEMGYSDEDIKKIFDRETIGINEKEMLTPPEAAELMEVQPYQAPEPWAPKPQEWCWTEVEGSLDFKLSKFEGYKEGQKYYKFDGVLPMAEILNQQNRIDPMDVIRELSSVGDPELPLGDYWHTIKTPAPDAPNGFDVNVWDDGYSLKMTAYAMIEGDDSKLRTSTLHPLMTHTFTPDELRMIENGIAERKANEIQQVASEATSGKSLLDAVEELSKNKPNPEPKA
ncbi:hypothetical protein [Sulfuricurvum sp.]|uniref:hypothetical protein n=1 Tax=Sulfuricurvum sp. TaxID=2025608 RepID=UPI002609BAC1|nr:hypothetical protein [Sulfuricurvum sp.]MDD3596676.1 hypothetical protein [Sulfuricurvum sp.]